MGARDWRKRLMQGDLLHTENAYSRVPWMEAIVGCEIRAGAEEAMWPKPALGPNYEGMERIVPGDDNPWLVKLLALTRALVGNDGSYLVTHTLMRGPIDLLSALMGDVRMGLGFYDEPKRLPRCCRWPRRLFSRWPAPSMRSCRRSRGAGRRGCTACGAGHGDPPAVRLGQPALAAYVQGAVLPHDRAILSAFDYSIIDLHSAGTCHLHPVLIEVDELDASR